VVHISVQNVVIMSHVTRNKRDATQLQLAIAAKPSTQMNTIHRLREVLSRALTSPEICRNEQDLFDELMVQKSRLLKLFEVGPRNSQEQREIETGKVSSTTLRENRKLIWGDQENSYLTTKQPQ